MLAHNNVTGVLVSSGAEVEVLNWTADGIQYFLGFIGTGSYSGTFRLYVKRPTDSTDQCYYAYQTSPSNRTAYVADRAIDFPAGTTVSLRVAHDSENQETFYGTILGGPN